MSGQADPLATIAEAAEILADHPEPGVRAIGAWLAGGGDAALYAHLIEADDDLRGATFSRAVLTARNRLLHQAGALIPVGKLAVEIERYRSGPWLRDRGRTSNPYPADDRRAIYFEILRLRDHPIGERQIRRILTSEVF